ncbi:MAG: CpaF family protein, partial [Firmicutes bacterium]|nr:CpaF family protein [Bacillota bacterium]
GKRIFDSLRRLDILQPFLEEDSVTEIMVNGPEHIYVERNGRVVKTEARFDSRQRLEDVIQQIVGSVNRRVNEFNPIADARLADGYRVNVILPPVALNGPILTIRKFRRQPITVEEMVEWGTLTAESADFIRKLVEGKYNLFVCGGTGAGKTTLLNVLSNFIPAGERIITIEDAAELRLSAVENVITLETRNGGLDGKGMVTIRDLIKTSLRARPDRIIVGEVRGAEALDMLSAMNTGHEGSLSTGHANSAEDMISRIETMVLMGANLPIEAIRQQIASALDIFIYISRMRDGSRKVTEISQVVGVQNGRVQMEPLFAMTDHGLQRTQAAMFRRKGAFCEELWQT